MDIYNFIKQNIKKFDGLDYRPDNEYGMARVNKKTLGKFSDELAGEVLLVYAAVRSKAYSLRIKGKNPIKKVKEVKSRVVKKRLCF